MVLFGVDVDGQTGYRRLRGGRRPGHRRAGVGVPDRRRRRRASARTTAAAASGRRARSCPPWGWWCSTRPTATSPTAPPTAESVFALHITNGQLAWVYRPARPTSSATGTSAPPPTPASTPRARPPSWAWGARTAPTTPWTRPPGRCGGRPMSCSAGSRAASSPPPPTTGSRVYGSPPSATSGVSRATAIALRSVQPPRPADAGAVGPCLRRRHRGGRSWQASRRASFAPTTVAGGMTFNGLGLGGPVLNVRDAATGSSSTKWAYRGRTGRGLPPWATPWWRGSGTLLHGQAGGGGRLTPGGKDRRALGRLRDRRPRPDPFPVAPTASGRRRLGQLVEPDPEEGGEKTGADRIRYPGQIARPQHGAERQHSRTPGRRVGAWPGTGSR